MSMGLGHRSWHHRALACVTPRTPITIMDDSGSTQIDLERGPDGEFGGLLCSKFPEVLMTLQDEQEIILVPVQNVENFGSGTWLASVGGSMIRSISSK